MYHNKWLYQSIAYTKYHLFEIKKKPKPGNAFFPLGDKIWGTSGWAAKGWTTLIGGEAEEADVEEESRVWLPDPAGEDGTTAPGSPGNTCKMHPSTYLALSESKKTSISLCFREFVTLKTRQRSREGRLKTWRKR